MLTRIRKSMEEKEEGFTLIELLVVVIIIGILAAIAIPVFLNQRKGAQDAGAKTDLTQLALAETSIFTTTNKYIDNSGANATTLSEAGLTHSTGTNALTVTVNATGTAFCGLVTSESGQMWGISNLAAQSKPMELAAATGACAGGVLTP